MRLFIFVPMSNSGKEWELDSYRVGAYKFCLKLKLKFNSINVNNTNTTFC